MNVTPLSMQMIIPQSTEVSTVQQNMNNAVNAQQNFETLKQKADAELAQKQVRSKAEAEGGKITSDPDREKRQGGGYFSGGKRNASVSDEENVKVAIDPNRGSILDIRL